MRKIASVLIFLIIVSAAADAQIFDPRKTAKRKAEQRTNQKIDQTIDKALDKVFSGFGKNKKDKNNEQDKKENINIEGASEEENAAAQNALGNMMGLFGGKSTPPQPSYSFNSSYVMQVKSVSKKENMTMSMKYMFNDGGKVMGAKLLSTDNADMNKSMGMMEAMIFDWENNQLYNLMNMNGQKQYMGIKLDDNAIGDYAIEKNQTMSFTKTGKTKTILGYACDGYLSKDNKDEYIVWMSRNSIPAIAKYYDAMNKTSSSFGKNGKNQMAYEVNPEMLKLVKAGRAMLGMEMDDKGTRTEMEIIEINPSDNITISTEGYNSMMDMGALMKQAEQESKN
jgi:hypothetical protein